MVQYNSEHRVIYTGHRGGMYIITPSGHKRYGVKPRYEKVGAAATLSLAVTRRTRKNKGVKRPRAAPVMSILPNPYIRKTRKNAGVKRKLTVKNRAALLQPKLLLAHAVHVKTARNMMKRASPKRSVKQLVAAIEARPRRAARVNYRSLAGMR